MCSLTSFFPVMEAKIVFLTESTKLNYEILKKGVPVGRRFENMGRSNQALRLMNAKVAYVISCLQLYKNAQLPHIDHRVALLEKELCTSSAFEAQAKIKAFFGTVGARVGGIILERELSNLATRRPFIVKIALHLPEGSPFKNARLVGEGGPFAKALNFQIGAEKISVSNRCLRNSSVRLETTVTFALAEGQKVPPIIREALPVFSRCMAQLKDSVDIQPLQVTLEDSHVHLSCAYENTVATATLLEMGVNPTDSHIISSYALDKLQHLQLFLAHRQRACNLKLGGQTGDVPFHALVSTVLEGDIFDDSFFKIAVIFLKYAPNPLGVNQALLTPASFAGRLFQTARRFELEQVAKFGQTAEGLDPNVVEILRKKYLMVKMLRDYETNHQSKINKLLPIDWVKELHALVLGYLSPPLEDLEEMDFLSAPSTLY